MDIREVNAQPEMILQRLQRSPDGKANSYVCPKCGSGTGKEGNYSGALHYYANSRRGKPLFHCYACGVTLDCYDMLKLTEGAPMRQLQPSEIREQTRTSTSHAEIYSRYGEAVTSRPAAVYLQRRGISTHTASLYKLRYNSRYNSLLIPQYTHDGAHIGTAARSIDGDAQTRYKQLTGSHTGLSGYTGGQRTCIFVCEGVFDAMSIYEACGAAAVATNGKYVGELLKMQLNLFTAAYIVADKDEDGGGLEHARRLQKQISEKFRYTSAQLIMWAYHDTNDFLLSDRRTLQEQLAFYVHKAEEIERAKLCNR